MARMPSNLKTTNQSFLTCTELPCSICSPFYLLESYWCHWSSHEIPSKIIILISVQIPTLQPWTPLPAFSMEPQLNLKNFAGCVHHDVSNQCRYLDLRVLLMNLLQSSVVTFQLRWGFNCFCCRSRGFLVYLMKYIFQVSDADTLPLQLCFECTNLLIQWDAAVLVATAADKKLKALQWRQQQSQTTFEVMEIETTLLWA